MSYSQEDFKFGLFGGPDFSHVKAPVDSIETTFGVSPFVGFELYYPINDRNTVRLGSSFSVKKSATESQVEYRNSFITLFGNIYQPISKKISLFAGPQYSILVSSRKINGANSESTDSYSSFLSMNVGVDFQIQKNLNFGVSYEYPINNSMLSNMPSFKAKLSLTIDKNLFKVKEKKQAVKYSQQKIKELKKTALLIRLRGYRKQIERYEKVGNAKMVNFTKRKRDMHNSEIISAFTQNFDFCPVYFFYNYDTDKIKNKEFKNVFLNHNLKHDSTIVFQLDTFLIGELGYVVTDTVTVIDNHIIHRDQANRITYEPIYYQQNDFTNYGFSIRDQDFKFIGKPFPAYISGYFAFYRLPPRIIVERVNKKLKGIKTWRDYMVIPIVIPNL